MTRLISGRVFKVDSANVSADRYQFIDVSEAEPDLGIPNAGGQVVASNTSGGRYWVTLNTANVTESSNNLYFTNARVDARINASLTSANIVGLTTANVTEAASNLYYTNARVDAQVDPKLTTSNVAELTNLYYTNARVSAHIDDVITTSNIDEGVNLYYTNARVRSTLSGGTGVSYNDVTGVIDIGQNVFPNASVSFGNVVVTGNLSVLGNTAVFETNTIAITDPLIQVGKNPVGDVYDLGFFGHYIDGVERHAGLFRDASDGQFKLFTNLDAEPLNIVDTANASYQNANLVVNYIIGKVTDISNHTTTDLAEGTNLYYTNARARTSVSAGEGISYDNTTGVISANLSTSVGAVLPYLTTANVAEVASNLYYTNARVNAFVQPFLTTANVAELNNLYFTNTRARDALVDANISVGNLIISGDLEVQGNAVYLNAATLVIEDKNIIIANNAPNAAAADGAGITIEGANANIQYSNAGDKITVNKNFEITGNLTFVPGPSSNVSGISTLTTDAVIANVWTNLYTANVRESASNLYYTDARVVEAVNNFITTGNIDESAEGINLYYTNARVNAWVQPFLTTANVIESASNLYFTNARVDARITASLSASNVSGLTTANVIEVNNLYYTNARVNAFVQSLLTTANVREASGNLYFTNARARAAFTAGRGIDISATGIISAGEGTYSLALEDSGYLTVLDTPSNLLVTSSAISTVIFNLRSIHVTNISNQDAAISGNVIYSADNTQVPLANKLPVPVGASLELMERSQLLNPGDYIQLQGFDASGVATSNLLQAVYTYESIIDEDQSYLANGFVLANASSNVVICNASTSFSIVESIKAVNLTDITNTVRVFWADANNIAKAYLAFNVSIPPNSTIELLGAPKKIPLGDKLFASYGSGANNSVSIFVSSRFGFNYQLVSYSATVEPLGIANVSYISGDDNGTLLHYTIENI